MSQMSNFFENKLADFFRAQGLTLPGNWYFALGSAADDSSFTEITFTGYARVAVARSLVNFAGTQGPGTTLASTGTSHASSNNSAISWGNPGSAGSGIANFVGVFDAVSAGNCWMFFPIDAITITTGSPNPVEVEAGALGFTLGLVGCSDYLANKLIDLIFRAQAYTWPATVYLALYTAAPTNAGGGTEVAIGSYARASIIPSLTSLSGTQSAGSTTASSGTSGRISNNAIVAYPAPTADWATVVAEAMRDAATLGNLLLWSMFGEYDSDGILIPEPQTIVSGGPAPSHAANTMGITLA